MHAHNLNLKYFKYTEYMYIGLRNILTCKL